jgi:hypothetical protein
MIGSPFWRVPDNFWIFQRRARWKRIFLIRIEGEPTQKRRRGSERSAIDFQRQVIEGMELYRRYPFHGPIALDLHFTSTRSNPPIIYHVAKHTLDVLGTAHPANSRPRRRSVLYRDDRQVKFLYVALDQEWKPSQTEGDTPPKGSVFLIARPARDAVTDLCVAYELNTDSDYEDLIDDYDDDEELDPFHVPDLPDDLDMYREPFPEPTPMQEFLNQSIRFQHAIDLQESILARTDRLLAHTLAGYLKGLSDVSHPVVGDLFRENLETERNLLLSSPLSLPLPGLPQVEGTSDAFAELVRGSLQTFKDRWPLFRSLLVPVKVTFLVIPPEKGKDLDNIALTVLPIAHEVLRPHIQPHVLAPDPPDAPSPWVIETRKRLRSLNANSVAAYQVIELPRSPEDPPGGTLRLALGRHSRESWWNRAAGYIDEMTERVKDRTW